MLPAQDIEHEYKQIESITEYLFKDVLSIDKSQFDKLKTIKAEDAGYAYSAQEIKKLFEERNPKSYHRYLEKHMKKMIYAFREQVKEKVDNYRRIMEESHRRYLYESRKQMEESRKYVVSDKIDDLRRLVDSLQYVISKKYQKERVSEVLYKSRTRSEWYLLYSLLELIDEDKKKWLNYIKRYYSEWKQRDYSIRYLKMTDYAKYYIDQLLKINNVDNEVVNMIDVSWKSQTERIKELEQTVDYLNKTIKEKDNELSYKYIKIQYYVSMNEQRRYNLKKRYEEVENKVIYMYEQTKILNEQTRALNEQIKTLNEQVEILNNVRKYLDDTRQQRDYLKVNHEKFQELYRLIDSYDGLNEAIRVIQRHFKKFKDLELYKLADLWTNNENTLEYAIRMEYLIALRLYENRKRMLYEGGFQYKLQYFMNKTTTVIEGVITKAIDAFNKIYEIVLDKFFSIRLEPINDKIKYDLESVVDYLAKYFHYRIVRIASRLEKIKTTNHRKAVEYVMRGPQRYAV